MEREKFQRQGRTIYQLIIRVDELPPLITAVKQTADKLQAKFDKLQSIFEIGEATDKQTTELCKLKEKLDPLNNFLNEANIMIS